jgi:hypothetical protein
MPDIHLVTYASRPLYSYTRLYVVDYKKQQDELNKLGLENGLIIHAYDDEWLKSTDFYEKNIEILSEPKGAGYWLWKPYIILKTLEKIPENDIVFYLDVDHYFTPNVGNRNFISLIKEHLERDVYDSERDAPSQLFFIEGGSTLPNIGYVKRDALILTGCDSEEYWYSYIISAGFICWKNNSLSKKIVKEWLRFSRDKRILTNTPSQLAEEYPEFQRHNADASALSMVVAKNNLRKGHFDIENFIFERKDIEEKFKI